MDASTEKKELRRLALARRDALCAKPRAAAGADCCAVRHDGRTNFRDS